MDRLLDSLMKVIFAWRFHKALGVGEESDLPSARFNEGSRQYTVALHIKRDK